MQSDGTQYEYYKSKGVTTSNYSGASSSGDHWTRSVRPSYSTNFCYVISRGDYNSAPYASYVHPAFSF